MYKGGCTWVYARLSKVLGKPGFRYLWGTLVLWIPEGDGGDLHGVISVGNMDSSGMPEHCSFKILIAIILRIISSFEIPSVLSPFPAWRIQS